MRGVVVVGDVEWRDAEERSARPVGEMMKRSKSYTWLQQLLKAKGSADGHEDGDPADEEEWPQSSTWMTAVEVAVDKNRYVRCCDCLLLLLCRSVARRSR